MKKDYSFVFRLLGGVLTAALIAVAVFAFASSIGDADKAQQDKHLQQLEISIRRTAAACYASEGSYPPSLEYLTSKSGIQIDESRYTVFYEVFAENLMPQITVIPNK